MRKGWQVNAGEVFYIRKGSFIGPGWSYSTDGFGFRLRGVLNLIESLDPSVAASPVFSFVNSHLDIRFDHSSEGSQDPFSPRNGTTYNGLNLVLK